MPFKPLSTECSADADETASAEICAAVEELVYGLVRSMGGVGPDSEVSDLGIENELRDIATNVTAKHWCKDSSGASADRDKHDEYGIRITSSSRRCSGRGLRRGCLSDRENKIRGTRKDPNPVRARLRDLIGQLM